MVQPEFRSYDEMPEVKPSTAWDEPGLTRLSPRPNTTRVDIGFLGLAAVALVVVGVFAMGKPKHNAGPVRQKRPTRGESAPSRVTEALPQRRNIRTEDIPSDMLVALQAARMDPRHSVLDHLMDD